jgi:hypothetical protein
MRAYYCIAWCIWLFEFFLTEKLGRSSKEFDGHVRDNLTSKFQPNRLGPPTISFPFPVVGVVLVVGNPWRPEARRLHGLY